MKTVIQRVTHASVTVKGEIISEIQKGLLILLGIGPEDTKENAAALVKKISALRIFEDDHGKMNLSIQNIAGKAIVVSQFTLYADCRKGNRPSFTSAAKPEHAEPLVDQFIALMNQSGIPTQSGIFGADMQVSLINDGPVTILLEN